MAPRAAKAPSGYGMEEMRCTNRKQAVAAEPPASMVQVTGGGWSAKFKIKLAPCGASRARERFVLPGRLS
jgi:hypothetical protein